MARARGPRIRPRSVSGSHELKANIVPYLATLMTVAQAPSPDPQKVVQAYERFYKRVGGPNVAAGFIRAQSRGEEALATIKTALQVVNEEQKKTAIETGPETRENIPRPSRRKSRHRRAVT